MKKRDFLPLFLVFVAVSAIFAQPANDECDGATALPNVVNWCSAAGQFSNAGATASGFGPATCFGTTANDVWFKFVAVATDVRIVVRGATQQGAGGTLVNPQVAMYLGACTGTVNQLECQSAPAGANIVEAYQGGLFVGATYLIRVQGAGNAVGTFQLCLYNFNPPVEPTSDCPTSALLCDKTSFVVENVTGAGTNTKELDDAACFSNGAPVNNESNSTWFTWICDQPGPLEFTLTPLNASDDLDFVVYRLPQGIKNCTDKEVIRCNAAGDNKFPSPCMGPTGLKSGDPDISEDAGCTDAGDDAWISPFNMVAGETYALAVNNFSSTGNGFSIQFGGTGTFLGPEPKFTTVPNAVCLGTEIEVFDASTFALGSITEWAWSFGVDATPQVATGKGSHKVTFSEPGQHSVVLTVKTDLGCKVTDIQTVTVFPDVEVDTVIAAPECNGGTNGVISITNILKGTPPYQFSWEGGPFVSQNSYGNLSVGEYNVVIKDANNCETELDIQVDELQLTVAPDIAPPLCFGDANGEITLNVTNGSAPYQFDWGSGFQNDNSMGGFTAGVYTILGLDAKLCKGTFNVTVTDNPELKLAMDWTDITCFGANDGMAEANPVGGVGNFTYLWSDGQTSKKAVGLGPGTYFVTVSDGNECSIVGEVTIIEPEDVNVRVVEVVDLLCNGVPEGQIRVQGLGGRLPYEFSADGSTYQSDSLLQNLPAGDYWIKIKDAGGCVDSVFASIIQPPALIVNAEPADTLVSLGFQIDVKTITAPVGRPVTFSWFPTTGLSCSDCKEPTITAIGSTTYVVEITDETGCVAYDTVNLRVLIDRPIYPPNIITPNGNYPNNAFTLYSGPAATDIALLRIYDRWGELVFEKTDFPLNDPNYGWDGTFRGKRLEGVFAFYALVRFVDAAELIVKGNVTVIR